MGNANECLWEDLLHQQAARHKSMGAAFVGSKEGSNYSFSAISEARNTTLMRNCEMKAGGKKKVCTHIEFNTTISIYSHLCKRASQTLSTVMNMTRLHGSFFQWVARHLADESLKKNFFIELEKTRCRGALARPKQP